MGWNFYNASGELQINDGGVSATAASITNDLTVTSGNVVIGTAGKGIDFSINTHSTETGVTMANELFDWYEKGTWTPLFTDAGDNTSSYSTQVGRYTRVGNLVYVTGHVVMSNIDNLTASNPAYIAGLPFTAEDITGLNFSGSISFAGDLNSGAANETVGISVLENEAKLQLFIWDISTGTGNMLVSEVSANGDLHFAATYRV